MRARTFASAADAWPDVRSPTGRTLRLMALDAGYRARGLQGLAAALKRTPAPQLPVALRHSAWLLTRAPKCPPRRPGKYGSSVVADDPGR